MLAIILDIDDTVYRQQAVFEQAVLEYINIKSHQLTPLFIASRKYSDESFIQLQKGQITKEEMYIYRFTRAFLEIGIQITSQQALAIQKAYQRYQKELHLDTEIVQLLNECQQNNITLGIITNGDSEHQWQKIHQLGLLTWMTKDAVIVSGDVGIIKPNPSIFKLLEDRLQLDPKDTYYIGDAYHNDVIGALSAGWQSIWLNQYAMSVPNQHYLPHYIVKERKELLSLIRKLKA